MLDDTWGWTYWPAVRRAPTVSAVETRDCKFCGKSFAKEARESAARWARHFHCSLMCARGSSNAERWSPERHQQLQQLLLEGRNSRECAAALGVSRGTVSGYVHRHPEMKFANAHGTIEEQRKKFAERHEEIGRLHALGYTRQEMVAETGWSYNQIDGYVRKLRVGARPAKRGPKPGVKRAIALPKRRDPFRLFASQLKTYPITTNETDLQIPAEQRRSLMELERHHCRWPVGDPGKDLFFCGAQALDRETYCAGHYMRAYRQG